MKLFSVVEAGPSQIHGLGVFATMDIPDNALVEICPVIVLNRRESKLLEDEHILDDRLFHWPSNRSAIALGCGSLYNHSDNPNAQAVADPAEKVLRISSLRRIRAGEEITIRYHDGWKP